MYRPRRVRLDDVVQGVGFEFADAQQVFVARAIGEVTGVLRAAEAAALAGFWVVGFVTYEAASAFDDAFPSTTGSAVVPLAWFAAFARRDVVELVQPAASGPFVADVQRAGGGEWYQAGVEQVRRLIEAGDVYQVNLTDRVRCRLSAEPFDLYRSMVATQGGAFNAFIDLDEAVVISASPELFLEVDGDTVVTRPMKGTRRRHGRPERDHEMAAELLASEKDLAENVMIVDLLRNDLTRVSSPGGVSVPELFNVERYDTVWQLTSTVAARLRPEVGLVDVFRATFPCGSITGAPKVSAMQSIDRLEQSPRGLYCGAIGMISPSTGGQRSSSIWSVAIRTAVVDTASGVLEYGAGGGITYDSVPADEDDELESKTDVLRRARTAFELFETLRLDAHGVHRLAPHLRRLAASADYFGFPYDTAKIASQVVALPTPRTPHRLRIVLERSGRHRVETYPLDELPAQVRLAVSAERVSSSDPFLCHKTSRRAVYDQARASHPDADDVLLVNERDEVVETTIANLLYRLENRWYTPPLTSGGLPGIGRQALVADHTVSERVLPLDELRDCAEFAVVNSLRGRRPAEILLG
jgi:para-aminobenzoate synthetase / 4-amino-4-deoxychorismate lyase